MASMNGFCDGTSTLVFFVNGEKITEPHPDPEMTLLTYLRTRLHLTGSKLGCGEGGCGACTVMVSHYDPSNDRINVNACLAPVCSLHGRAVTTVEGIATPANGHLHPVQERLAKFHGSQCGFCTPGIVMSMYTLLRNNPQPSAQEMEAFFDGNLCRCTGYRPILSAFQTFTKDFKCGMGERCCRSQQNGLDTATTEGWSTPFQQKMAKSLKPYDPTQELIFPAELKVRHKEFFSKRLEFQGPNVRWIRPCSLSDLIHLKTKHANAKIVCGNTEIGIETKFKNQNYPVLIYCSAIPELSDITLESDGVKVGASVTLTQMDVAFKKIIKTEPEYKTRILAAFVEMLRWFAGHQIRNVATLSGNVMTASPISDLNPLLVAAGARAHLISKGRGSCSLPIDRDFFQGYRKTAVAKDEVLESVTIPFTNQNTYFHGYKQANRKDDDISLVNAGMKVVLSEQNQIQDLTLAFGGMGVTVVVAKRVAQSVTGSAWAKELVPKVCNLLVDDLPLPPGSPGGVASFRKTVALSFFFKFFLSVDGYLSTTNLEPGQESAVEPLEHRPSRGIQVCGARDSREMTEGVAVGKSLPHQSALQQCTGRAVYLDDMPLTQGELHLCLVTSAKARATILNVDASKARNAEGFRGFVSADDIPQERNHLSIYMDTIFASREVTCQGQVIAGVLADSQSQARRAAGLVKVEYQEQTPIVTIEDAIKHNSYQGEPITLSYGDLEAGFASSDHVIEGECRINGQNHFYLETMATRAVPLEDGQMEIFCSTQHPSQLQSFAARALGEPMSKILVRTKRLGGGFGGKETQYLYSAIPTVIAARKCGQVVRCVLDRDEDMRSTGNRHPYLARYKVGFSSDGKVQALDLQLYSNAGNSVDRSLSVLNKIVVQTVLTYFVAHTRVTGRRCQTNVTSNTAFRGFGGPQGQYVMETVMEGVADFLGLSPHQVKEKNFYQAGDPCRVGGPSNYGDAIRDCWRLCVVRSDFHARRRYVDEYNRANRWKKKGLALAPLRYGIAFMEKELNKGGALVHIYHDGSVLITHGGVEMGQGLFVKMAQIASEVLAIPLSYVRNSETSTATVVNTSPTAGSIGADLNGMAVKEACEILNDRLAPFKKDNPKGSWEDWVQKAVFKRVSLSATGFFKTPGLKLMNFQTGEGNPLNYSTVGAACSEVQIDCLTGDHKVLRTDIVMDIGRSINPAIDVGQIQGAFMQGYGLYMLEEVKMTPEGTRLTQGPGTYKIPAFGNIPTEFNVHILPDSHNPYAVFGSRGVGEPPLLLASSVFFATKDAIKSARSDAGKSRQFRLNSPAMPAYIRMACQDQFTQYFSDEIPGTYKPWFVDL